MSLICLRLSRNDVIKHQQIVSRSFASANLDFAAQRFRYQEKLSVLRKQWNTEHLQKVEKSRLAKVAEEKRIVLRQAVRLRQDRIDAAVRREAATKSRAGAMAAYREKLAHSHILSAEKDDRQLRRFDMAVADLEAEKSAWITLDNMDEKITSDLFETHATTGLTTKYSNLWRYQAFSADFERTQREEYDSPEEYADKILNEGEMAKRMEIETYLNTLIGTGEERVNYKKMLQEFMDFHLNHNDRYYSDDERFYTMTDYFHELAGGVFGDNCVYVGDGEVHDMQPHGEEEGEEEYGHPQGDDDDEDFVDIENPWSDGKMDTAPAPNMPQKQQKGGSTSKQHKRKNKF